MDAAFAGTVPCVNHVEWRQEPSEIGSGDGALRSPVLIVAFEGWNDAGESASSATRHVADTFDAQPFASIDPEPFYDFTNTRPFVAIDGNEQRQIEWPENEFAFARVPTAERDLIVFTGVEPQLRWRTFCEQILDVATQLGVEMVVSLGALIADVAHSRPTTIYGTSGDAELRDQLGLQPSRYEGPTGIVGVLHDACDKAGLKTVSLWGTVPSYVPHANSPKAALALVDRLGSLIDVPILGRDLVQEAADYESQITELVEDDLETRTYIEGLERSYDEALRADSDSSAEMIEDLEKFLRDQ